MADNLQSCLKDYNAAVSVSKQEDQNLNIIKKRLYITGMTCVNCQNRIEKKLSETEGIKSAKVSYNKGTADISYDTDEISLKSVIKIVEGLGYQVTLKQQESAADLDRIIPLLVLIVSLFVLLQQLGILNLLVPSQLADSKMGYGMLFFVGLLTSVHCIAMCGGINLSCCLPRVKVTEEKQKAAEKSTADFFAAFLPAICYNAGRVVSYTVIGFALGFVGMILGGGSGNGLSTFLQGILKLIAGVFMVIMGINMLDLFPWLKKFGLRMPKFFAVRMGKQKRKGSGPFFIGLLNGLMPCGPLQAMQIVALASANPLAGALSMFFFSLGTVPLMLGLGSIVAALGQKFTQTVMRVGAVLVTVLGLAMLSQGVSLSGIITVNQLLFLVIALCVLGIIASMSFRKAAYKRIAILAAIVIFVGMGMSSQNSAVVNAGNTEAAQTSEAEIEEDVQVVTSTLTIGRYPNITVTAGIPVKWIINAPEGSINACNHKMLIREYGIEYTFHEGENVIEFTPTEAGTITYTCWMGMIRANIFVTEADSVQSDASETNSASAVQSGGADESAPEATDAALEDLQESEVPYPADYRIPTEELAIAEKTVEEDGNAGQTVEITLTQDGFSPAVIVVEKGVDTSWIIQNELAESQELLAVLYSTTLPLASGENTLYLYPVESFDVSTGDSAFYAYVKVVDDLENIDEDAIRREVEEYEPYVYPSSVFEGVTTGGSCCY